MSRPWIAGAALLVTVLTAVSTVLGLARDVVIAAVFGAGGELDGYFVALGLMNVALGLLAGAMSKAAVPVLSRQAAAEDGDGDRRSSRTLSVAVSVTVVGLGVATLVMQLFAAEIVAVLAPGFGPAEAESAERLTRIVLIATVLIAGTNLLAAAAQSRRAFFWSAIQGVPFNLSMIVAAAVFGPEYGVTALAWGFVVGSAARLLAQLPPLRRLGLRLRPRLTTSDPDFRAMVRLIPPLLLGSAIGNVNTLVDRAVGSTIGDGVISSLSYAWRLVSLADTVLIASLVVALYPALSTAAGDTAELRRLVDRGLGATMVVLVPICIGTAVAAGPVVETVFRRGEFTADDATTTATALLWYAPAVLALGWREVIVRASYALDDTRRPVAVAVVAMVVNVVGDLTLGLAFGIPGLAASTSLSLVVAAAGNTWLLSRRHDGVAVGALWGLLRRTTVSATVTLGAALGVTRLVGDLPAVAQVAAVGAGCLTVFAAATLLQRGPETSVLRDAARLLRGPRARA
ncbi:murein biosynthesis integral membrane protein MurJ [Jiangella rhizosphaerae]|uniref:Probable lipid II flippase MurJ n=1 Tax=Jiangella rhizosphaerae TaxID=2293569 RepID=A0A418KGN3_9ACTN|nr:murein biosynthesis integral membrane protein MurJ [Jiangella rhizosphaerae]RIQ11147.1 murein biosynthesis integral membrane protein MurJ [Jiangella rhizosphaerae]